MKRWYAFYCELDAIRQQPADELAQQPIEQLDMVNRQQIADDLSMPEILE